VKAEQSIETVDGVEPLAELRLELGEPVMVELEGKRRARAMARLVYEPPETGAQAIANEAQPVASQGHFDFMAPIGAIEAEELRWYLERYYIWPDGLFRERAEKVERDLEKWGQALYEAAMQDDSARRVVSAWEAAAANSRRCFSVQVDEAAPKSSSDKKRVEAAEAAARLQGLPWELMHDGTGFLFQGKPPVRVRRRRVNHFPAQRVEIEPPIRILLVSPRPEDRRAGYIDHRASALPLVEAMEKLGDRVELKLLAPPTIDALQAELKEATGRGQPYHVVHFDGHGTFRRKTGRGGLVFEAPGQEQRLAGRRSIFIDAKELGAQIQDYRIPLFFLEACQSETRGWPR
jgi:hypothetical protein